MYEKTHTSFRRDEGEKRLSETMQLLQLANTECSAMGPGKTSRTDRAIVPDELESNAWQHSNVMGNGRLLTARLSVAPRTSAVTFEARELAIGLFTHRRLVGYFQSYGLIAHLQRMLD